MRTKNGSIARFQYKSMDLLLLNVNKLETNSVLLQINFVFISIIKNLSF